MIPRTAASASSPFRGKMPSSGKVPRVPSVVTGHPQGGALRNPSPPDGPKTRHLRFRPKRNLSFCLQMEHDRIAPDRAIRRHGHRWRIGRPGGMGGKPCQTKHAFSSLTTTRTSVNCSPPTSPVTTWPSKPRRTARGFSKSSIMPTSISSFSTSCSPAKTASACAAAFGEPRRSRSFS